MRKLNQLAVSAAAALLAVAGVGADHAAAAVAGGPKIVGNVSKEGDAYRYSYTIDYTEGLFPTAVGDPVIQFSIPLFDLGEENIRDLHSPAPWNANIFKIPSASNWGYNPALDPDAGNYGVPASSFVNPMAVLTWNYPLAIDEESIGTASPVPGVIPGQTLSGFDFLSDYAPGNGPAMVFYLVEIGGGEPLGIADPPIPNSPNAPFAQPTGVPEPLTASLGGIALSALALGATRRRKA